MTRKIIIAAVVAGLVSCAPRQQMPQNSEYETMTVALSDQTLTSSYSASIRGCQDVDIYPQISGVLSKVCVREGAVVGKGELLFVIDQAPYKAALAKANANVESAKAALSTAQMTFDSKQQLYDENVVSQFDLQSAQNTLLTQNATLQQAKAELVVAQTNLSYTEIRSPSNGVAGMVKLREGALVNSAMSEPLITVSDNSSVQVYFSMSENDYLALTATDSTSHRSTESFPDVELQLSDHTIFDQKGRIDAVSGIVDSATGAVSIRATFANPNRVVRSGSRGNLLIPHRLTNVIVIPQQATYEIQDMTFVYCVVDSKAKSTPVEVYPINNGTDYIVTSGLKAGDQIVAEGAGLVHEGAEVKSKNEK